MPKASPLYASLNAGEFSPLLEGRVDFSKYNKGLKQCENFVPLAQGPLLRRSGTRHVGAVKDSSKAVRLVRFEFSVTQPYILEFGELYIRIYLDHERLSAVSAFTAAFTAAFGSAGVVEVTTPYVEADLFQLKFTQSADVLYIVHPEYAPRTLSRSAATVWTLAAFDYIDGPYLSTNTTTTTLTPAATTGSGITITASATTGINGGTGFASTDVGRLIRLKHGSTWGYGKIVTFTDTTHVNVDIVETFGGVGAVTTWRLGSWSDTTGWPAAVVFHRDRLAFGGGRDYPLRLDLSVVGDYTNFQPSAADGTVADDDAVAFTLNANRVNNIIWLASDEKGLLIGTAGAEWVITTPSTGENITPTNIPAGRASGHGSKNMEPVQIGKETLFVQRSGRKLRTFRYRFEDDGFAATDLTIAAEHITSGGVVQLAHQAEPQSILWAVRADGQLLGLAYEPDQEVLAWFRVIVGGTFGTGDAVVESAAIIPNPDATADEVWAVVKRTINGATVRHIEYFEALWSDTNAQADAYFVDCGTTQTPIGLMVTNLDHLEGETVQVLLDGGAHPDAVVTSGDITLVRTGAKAQVGLAYKSKMWTENIEAGAADGTAQGKTKRIHRIIIRFWETLNALFGASESATDRITFREVTDPMGVAPALFTGDKERPWPGGYERQGRIYIEQDQPYPMCVVALMPQLHTEDR